MKSYIQKYQYLVEREKMTSRDILALQLCCITYFNPGLVNDQSNGIYILLKIQKGEFFSKGPGKIIP